MDPGKAKRKFSDETRKRMSEAAKLRISKMTFEERKKMTECTRTPEARKKNGLKTKMRTPWNKGKKGLVHSEETRIKIGEASKKHWREFDKEFRQKQINRLINLPKKKNENTSIELKVKDQLDRYGIKYVQQKPLKKAHFVVDFYLPEYKLVIECNGDYWHNLDMRKKRDKELEQYVKSKGRDILWLWEHEIRDSWFDIADYLEV